MSPTLHVVVIIPFPNYISDVAGATQCLPSQALGPAQEGTHPSTSGTPQGEFTVMVIEGEERRIPIISDSSLESR